MGCCNSTANVPPDQVPENIPITPVTRTVPVSTPPPPVPEPSSAAPLTRSRSRTQSTNRPTSNHQDQTPRKRVASAPHHAPPSTSSPSQDINRTRAKSVAVASTSTRASRSGRRLSTPGKAHPPGRAGTRSLVSTMGQVISMHPKFRILVVGKRGSGKSSLINAVFKVGTSAKPGNINQGISGNDNRYLVFHEYSGFGPGDDQSRQTIRDFISSWADPNRPSAEKLDAVWICVPTSDAMNGSIGEGIEEILGMNQVPVIIAFTKFDQAVANEGGSQGSARTNARARFEQSCRPLFQMEPRAIPGVIVSVRPKFNDLINDLVLMTHRFITGSSTPPTAWRSGARGTKPRLAPVPLVWSAALRVNQDIFIQASIEIGRGQYWRGLWSSVDFVDQPLKECVNVIHTDIVEIWNLKDEDGCLSGQYFKARMSQVVEDLAGPVSNVQGSSEYAEWVWDRYRASGEHVRSVMGYIVDLTVVLDDIFRMGNASVSVDQVEAALDRHMRSDRRNRIHRDISDFVADTLANRFTMSQTDMALEKIIDLLGRYCVPSSRGYG